MLNDLNNSKTILLNNKLDYSNYNVKTYTFNKDKFLNICNNNIYNSLENIESLYLLNNFKIKYKDINRFKFNVSGSIIIKIYFKSINRYMELIRSYIFLYDILSNQENQIIKKFRERTPAFYLLPRIEINGEIYEIDENSDINFIINTNISIEKIDYEKIKKNKLKTMYKNLKDDYCVVCYNIIDTSHINNKVCKNGHCLCDICFTQIDDKIQCCYCKQIYKN
jgi:hypothetical protein